MTLLNHFNFKTLDDGDFLITNDYGRALFLSPEEFQRFLRQDFNGAEALYQRLHRAHFVLEPMEIYADSMTDELREMKQYLCCGTALQSPLYLLPGAGPSAPRTREHVP